MAGSAAALALLLGAVQAAGLRITLEDGVFRARPASPSGTLHVFVDGPAELPPLLGDVRREGDAILFEPRFAVQEGMRYRAVYSEPGQAARVEVFAVPAARARPPAEVERIDPTRDVLPENQLKLYVSFSAPMSRGEAYRRIRLLDESGRKVELPFLEIDQELWDHDTKRLTLLFDPGRVKRDLLPHEEAGTPLREGSSYTLVVDRDFPDAHGSALAREARKSFRVGPPDHDPPHTSNWRVIAPRAGTREALSVRFPEPLDRALLERVLEVVDDSGAQVAGAVSIDSQETRWRFTPSEPWKRGDYTLRVGSILEDLAGNSLGRPFEVDVFERVEDRALSVTESLRFRVE